MEMKKVLFPIRIALCVIMIMCTFVGCGNKQMEPSSSEPERNEHGNIEITFFTGNSLDLIRIAEDYNAQSDIYEVVCPEESVKGEDWENKRKRLQMDMLSGKGFDLYVDFAFVDLNVKPAVEKGAIMDLSDFFANHPEVNRNALKTVEMDGKYYGLPISFTLGTMVTSTNMATDRAEWTIDQSMERMENSHTEYFLPEEPAKVLYRFDYEAKYVDFVNRKSKFDSDDFIRMLEFSKKYGMTNNKDDAVFLMESGEIACVKIQLSSLEEMAKWKYFLGGKASYVGYPSTQSGKTKIYSSTIYGNANTKNKEGIYDFFSFIISKEEQRKLKQEYFMKAFSVRTDILEEAWDDASCNEMVVGYQDSNGGFHLITQKLSKDDEAAFWDILNNSASGLGELRYTPIQTIVQEEAHAYFSGQKTAREVADIIDNRVQLYLDEL